METYEQYAQSMTKLKAVRSDEVSLDQNELRLTIKYHGIGFSVPIQAQKRYINAYVRRVLVFVQSYGDQYNINRISITNTHDTKLFASALIKNGFHRSLTDDKLKFDVPAEWYAPPIEKLA